MAGRSHGADVFGTVLIAAATMLTVLTAMNFLGLSRYDVSGPSISVLGPDGIALVNDDPAAIERRDFALNLPAAKGFIRISAVAEGFDIAPGPRPWQRGRIVFLRHDADARALWDIPHVLALLKGNPVRWTFSSVFRGDDRARTMSARIELLKATGTLKVYRLTATPMRESHGFRAVASALMAGWAALAIAVSWWTMGRLRQRRWLIGLAWLVGATALVLSVLPAQTTSPARSVAVEAIDLVSSNTATEKEREAAVSANMFSIAKSGHVVMFFLVGGFVALARGRSSGTAIVLIAVGFAGLCEMLQLFSPNRGASGFDLMLNMVSAGAGAVLVLLLLWLLPRRFRRNGPGRRQAVDLP